MGIIELTVLLPVQNNSRILGPLTTPAGWFLPLWELYRCLYASRDGGEAIEVWRDPDSVLVRHNSSATLARWARLLHREEGVGVDLDPIVTFIGASVTFEDIW
jgi:hypothetical protein